MECEAFLTARASSTLIMIQSVLRDYASHAVKSAVPNS